ncbi:MAG: hypothetical protein AVDCRST_MAG19-2891 [uncultured Thermomicrobiales bacterium]|uniref:M23ase beta-sheet core domain-containing protein n=1 Tax=uncultured Thermomicrobiales bacterium TaxID=1645740 RepID=A0A6J4V901_9BACT|nr:MAG: hypothetical protein AVDCRST_MAG19-2891 [uncultured Thermomicrobiales bacterium]
MIAIGEGEVVFAGSDYPGAVVIVRHAPDLFSMYGHLDYAVPVATGHTVSRGDRLGTVLQRADEFPSHLHFEVRTFLTTTEVNGDAPRYGFVCGPGCAPGPGYWPIGAPDLPADQGWLNPTHLIARRGIAAALTIGDAAVVVAADPSSPAAAVRSAPAETAERIGTLPLDPGTRFLLLDVSAGEEAPGGTSAEAYDLWYRLRIVDGVDGWVQAAVASDAETGSDGRPSTVRFDLLPALPSG